MPTHEDYRNRFLQELDSLRVFSAIDVDSMAERLATAAMELCGHKTDEVRGDYKVITDAANRQVDGMLEAMRVASTKINYTGREMLPDPIRELMDAFVEATGLKPLKREVMGWLQIGQEWLDLHIQAKDVRGAAEYAKGKYAIMEPASLTKTIRSFKAGMLKLEEGQIPAIDRSRIEKTRQVIAEKEVVYAPMPESARLKLRSLTERLAQ